MRLWNLYRKYNPIIRLVIQPTLKLVDAHNHPIRGGIAAAIASGLAHYAIFLPFVWQETGLVTSLMQIPLMVHIFLGINILSNFLIGLFRYITGDYGDRQAGHQRGA